MPKLLYRKNLGGEFPEQIWKEIELMADSFEPRRHDASRADPKRNETISLDDKVINDPEVLAIFGSTQSDQISNSNIKGELFHEVIRPHF